MAKRTSKTTEQTNGQFKAIVDELSASKAQASEDSAKLQDVLESLAENIASVSEKALTKNELPIVNPELAQVFKSIEKQLISQTGFLRSIQSLQTNEFQFNKEMAKRAESERSRDLVSQEDGSNVSKTASPVAPTTINKEEASKGIFGLLSSIFKGLTIGGLASAILKKSLLAVAATAVGNFVSGVVEQTLKELGMSDKASAGIGEAATTGATWAIWGKVLFGNKGAIVGLLAGIGSKLGTVMESNKDNILGKIMSSVGDKGFWDEWGTEIATVIGGAVFWRDILWKIAKAIGVSMNYLAESPGKLVSKAASIATSASQGISTAVTATKDAAGTVASTVGKGTDAIKSFFGVGTAPKPTYAPGQFSVPGGITTQGSVSQLPVPSGTNVKGNGKVGPQSIDDIVNDLKKRGRTATLAKYAKFFKFAGPAMAIIPALIDPAMAIYNGKSEQDIKREIAGALGTIGGAYLGAIAGAAGTTLIPIVGQSGIGNLLGGAIGGVAGALSGEYLAEQLADALMGGPPPEPVSSEYDPSMPEALPFITSTPSAPASPTPSRGKGLGSAPGRVSGLNPVASPQITPVIPMAGKVSAITGMQSASASSTGAGVNVSNNMGGNVNNNTNVGGSATTYNIFQSSGSNALSNSLPVPMAG
jgi:hypothetical protein